MGRKADWILDLEADASGRSTIIDGAIEQIKQHNEKGHPASAHFNHSGMDEYQLILVAANQKGYYPLGITFCNTTREKMQCVCDEINKKAGITLAQARRMKTSSIFPAATYEG